MDEMMLDASGMVSHYASRGTGIVSIPALIVIHNSIDILKW